MKRRLRAMVSSLREQGIGVVIEETPPWLLHRDQYARGRGEIVHLVEEFHRFNTPQARHVHRGAAQ